MFHEITTSLKPLEPQSEKGFVCFVGGMGISRGIQQNAGVCISPISIYNSAVQQNFQCWWNCSIFFCADQYVAPIEHLTRG